MPKAEFLAAELVPSGPWFDLADASPAKINEGLLAVAPKLDHFLDEMLAKRRLPESHLALMGFSEGAMLALHVGLRRPKPMAAIVAFSGALYDLTGLETEIRSKPPVLFIHGEEDPVVPFAAMAETRSQLKALGVPAKSLKRRGLAHAIDDDGILVAGDFLTGLVAHKPAAKQDDRADEHDHEHEHQ